MSGTGIDMEPLDNRETKSSGQALLFIAPSIVVTVVSIALFALLTGFSAEQHNNFSITIMTAIVFSLLGTAGIQVLIYRVVDDKEHFSKAPALRGIKLGTIYSLLYSIVISAILSVYFLNGLRFPLIDFFYLAVLLMMYSIIWVITAAFWASGKYQQPAVIFVVSYLLLFGLTYLAHLMNPEYTISGYTVGIIILFLASCLVALRVFASAEPVPGLRTDVRPLANMVSKNAPAIAFNALYVLAIFLDKIIVWVSDGIASGQGILVIGQYTAGGFLGLIPMFSVAAIAYFTSRSRRLVEDRYKGTFEEIQDRVREYKRLYWTNLGAMLGIGVGLFFVVGALALFLLADMEIMRIFFTVALGSLFLMVIVHNAMVMPIFGKGALSAVAVLAVCLGELASIPFVAADPWYAALGFLLGSFIGFLISFISTLKLFSSFEYYLFRYVASSA